MISFSMAVCVGMKADMTTKKRDIRMVLTNCKILSTDSHLVAMSFQVGKSMKMTRRKTKTINNNLFLHFR